MTIFERIQAVLTFRNGTIVNLDESSIISASIKRQCCSDGKFEIGGVYAASLSMKCRVSGTNSFRIRGAKLVVSTKFDGVENDFIPRGTFWITDAQKNGEIYSVTAVDNVGWLDLDNYNISSQTSWKNFTEYFRAVLAEEHAQIGELHYLLGKMTPHVNSLANSMTGLSNILNWGHYIEGSRNEATGEWVGNDLYCNHKTLQNESNYYSLYVESDRYFSGSPMDLYRMSAQIAGGFIYARPEDGWLTLGQFGQKEFYRHDPDNPSSSILVSQGTIQIYPEHIEQDSFEFADFYLQVCRISARNNLVENNPSGYPVNSQYLYYPGGIEGLPLNECSPYDFTIENNSFVDGYVGIHVRGDMANPPHRKDNLFHFCETLYMYLNDRSKRQLVPFRCKVHKPERYQLGQRIDFYDENQEVVCQSVITSIEWTFRGGTWLSCAGKDERALSGCARLSKADKSIRAVNAGYFYEKGW